MKTKGILVFVVVAVVGVVIGSWMLFGPTTIQESAQAPNERILPPETSKHSAPPAVDAPTPEPLLTESARNISDIAPSQETQPDSGPKIVPAPAQAKKPKEPLHDPEARVALSLVGIDPEAEAYWLEAIFDPALPENEREDLMEDLNEDGLSDTKRPGPQDLPLILNRLAIIQEILPHADEFMVTHLGEAYKDLLNLADVTQGGGKPVR